MSVRFELKLREKAKDVRSECYDHYLRCSHSEASKVQTIKELVKIIIKICTYIIFINIHFYKV